MRMRYFIGFLLFSLPWMSKPAALPRHRREPTSSAERDESLVDRARAGGTMPAGGRREPHAPRAPELPVGQHGERLAEPAVARGAGRAGQQAAAPDQADVLVHRAFEEVLHLRAADAARGVARGAQP